MYIIVHYTLLYTVHFSMYTVHFSIQIVHFCIHIVDFRVYTVHFDLKFWSLYSVQFGTSTIHFNIHHFMCILNHYCRFYYVQSTVLYEQCTFDATYFYIITDLSVQCRKMLASWIRIWICKICGSTGQNINQKRQKKCYFQNPNLNYWKKMR